MSELLEKIEKAKEELTSIFNKTRSEDELTLGWDRFNRWKERLKGFIKSRISEKEAENFENAGPVSFSMIDGYGNFRDCIQHYDSHLQALIEDIKNNPESYGSSSESAKENTFSGHLATLHPIIYKKCKKLYDDGSYSESVEKGFKVVKDRLRELTSYEKGSEAFGKGKLHINGAAAPNVDEDFNEGVKFLTMAIDMFRNEKSHTADGKIDDATRAYEYLRLSSLAMNLLNNVEIR